MYRLKCVDSSLYCSDDDGDVAKPTACLELCPQTPAVDLVKRKTDWSETEHHATPSSIQDLDSKIDTKNPNSDDNNELSHSPSWFRFEPTTAISENYNNIPKTRHHYIAVVENCFRDQEFHRILGKEYINEEIHYLVNWVPTLVYGRVLHRAKAQPLISQFETSCEGQRRKKKRAGAHRLNGSGGTDRIRYKENVKVGHEIC